MEKRSKKFKISMLVLVSLFAFGLAGYSQAQGDVDGNGSVDIVDALRIAQYYVGLNPQPFNINVADANCSGSVDIVDALTVAQLYVGIISQLPTCGGTAVPTAVGTAVPTAVPTAVVTVGPTPDPGTHVDNPFSGANIYVNPDWSAKAAANGGSAIANIPTFVWIDRIAAISGGSGSCTFTSLTQHLDNAVSQGRNAIQLVIYDMPNRDCSSSGSCGELRISQDGINRYKTEYIDPIVAILKNYSQLRLICLVEPDSIPNLVTNIGKGFPDCDEANSSGAYQTCLRYAVEQLKSVGPNIYMYLDIAHDAWLGWDTNLQPFVNKMSDIIGGTTVGKSAIDGFLSNCANTLPWEEPFIGPDGNASHNGVQIKQARFIDWNPYTCERPFLTQIRSLFISAGFSSSIGMVLDTSRNGWGGPNRPTAASSASDINQWVDESRIDRRYHRGNWCNQGLAGIGARPVAAPASGMDAFAWIKPPGESDGQSTAGTDPCDPNKKLDQMCVPGGVNTYCNCGSNEALSGAPVAGGWFQALFNSLKANAYPPL